MRGRCVRNVWEYSDVTLFYRNDPSVFTESRVPNHKIQYYILSFIAKYDSLNIIYNQIHSFNNCIEYILNIITMSRNALFFTSPCRVAFKYLLLKYNIVDLLSIYVSFTRDDIFHIVVAALCMFSFLGCFFIMFGTCRLRAGWWRRSEKLIRAQKEKSRLKLRTKRGEFSAKFERVFLGSLAV